MAYRAAVQSTLNVLDHVLRVGLPLAVLDEERRLPLADWVRGHPNAATFSYGASASPVRKLVHHLLTLGHRRFVYFSPVHASTWSRVRLIILEETLDAAGLPTAVSSIVRDDIYHLGQVFVNDEFGPAVAATLRSGLPRSFAGRSLPVGEFAKAVGATAQRPMQDVLLRKRIETMIDEAIKVGDATAWICANDHVALIAMELLAQHGIQIPRDLSISGFDDEAAAFTRGLTTCCVNLDGLANAMLTHVLHPRLTPRDTPTVEVEGIVMARRTTAGPAHAGRPLAGTPQAASAARTESS
jgi:DNA-binding LacI/PurR family transcriptional regulator